MVTSRSPSFGRTPTARPRRRTPSTRRRLQRQCVASSLGRSRGRPPKAARGRGRKVVTRNLPRKGNGPGKRFKVGQSSRLHPRAPRARRHDGLATRAPFAFQRLGGLPRRRILPRQPQLHQGHQVPMLLDGTSVGTATKKMFNIAVANGQANMDLVEMNKIDRKICENTLDVFSFETLEQLNQYSNFEQS